MGGRCQKCFLNYILVVFHVINALKLIKYNSEWIVNFSARTRSINCVLSTCFIFNSLTFLISILRFAGADSLPGSGLLCLAAVGRLEVWTILILACFPCVSRKFKPVNVKIVRIVWWVIMSLLHQNVLKTNEKEELVSSPSLSRCQTTKIFYM